MRALKLAACLGVLIGLAAVVAVGAGFGAGALAFDSRTGDPVAPTLPVTTPTLPAPAPLRRPVAFTSSPRDASVADAVADPYAIFNYTTSPADFEPTTFDPVAYVPKATALMRTRFPDAELIRAYLNGVRSDGHIDFAIKDSGVTYRFWSAQG